MGRDTRSINKNLNSSDKGSNVANKSAHTVHLDGNKKPQNQTPRNLSGAKKGISASKSLPLESPSKTSKTKSIETKSTQSTNLEVERHSSNIAGAVLAEDAGSGLKSKRRENEAEKESYIDSTKKKGIKNYSLNLQVW